MHLSVPEELIKCDMREEPVSAILNGTGMLVRCAPPPLQSYLGCFWSLPGEAPAAVATLPDGCAQFTVELTRHAAPRIFLSGPRRGPGHYAKPPMTRVAGVRLRPGTGHLLWRRPMSELVDRRVAYPAPDLVARLGGVPEVDACFDALESYLAERLAGTSPDPRVAAAVRMIGESAGEVRMAVVARQCGIGIRQLERLMRVWVGLPPKRLARVARFQAMLGSFASSPGNPLGRPARDWTQIAAEAYADQSHLIHEFVAFAGASPRRFYAMQGAHASAARCR